MKRGFLFYCARGQSRTGTACYGHNILSVARLPITPPGRKIIIGEKRNNWKGPVMRGLSKKCAYDFGDTNAGSR